METIGEFEHSARFCYLWCSRKLQPFATQALSWDFLQNNNEGIATSLPNSALWTKKKMFEWPNL
jgi:hypothetical protein